MSVVSIGPKIKAATAFIVLISPSALMALIFTLPAPVLFSVSREYGQWTAQGMGNLPSLGIVVGGPLVGSLVKRLGSRGILIPAIALYALVGPMALFVHNSYILLASRFFLGFASAAAMAAGMAIIGARYQGAARLRVLGYQGGIGSLVGLSAIKASGMVAAAGTWRSPFALYGLAAILLPLALFTFKNQPDPKLPPSAGKSPIAEVVTQQWPIYLLIIALFGAAFSTGLQLSYKLGEHGIVDPNTQSNVIVLGSLFNGVSSTMYGWIRSWLSARLTFTLFIGLMAIGALLIGVGVSPITIGSGAAVMGLGSGMVGPHMMGLLLARVPEMDRAAAAGIGYSCVFLGEFTNPFFMQTVRRVSNIDDAFIALGVGLAIGAVWAFFSAESTSSTDSQARA